ncbi:putative phage tail protein [Tissierella sp.]|uniref:putative phage tail protein n=1 Tax=Tissierella sp. TaxID=41274 RepID=UPI00301FE8C8
MSQLSYKEIIENQLPEDLFRSKDIESQAIGNSLDKLQYDVDILENEVNPLTVRSKGLEQWEKFFKLPSNASDSIEIRKARVISELIQFMSDENVIRKDEMEEIVSLYTGECKIIEHFAEYMFEVVLNFAEKRQSLDTVEVYKIVKKIKPAWLRFILIIKREQKMNLYYGITNRQLKTNTYYPYSIEDVKITNPLRIGISSRIAKTSNYSINIIGDSKTNNQIFFTGICKRLKEVKMEVEHV